MIQTTIYYACDVEGCDSAAETKDVMAMGFGGVPKGWAALNWIAEVRQDGKNDPKRDRFLKAFKKMKGHMPPEVAEYTDAAKDFFIGEKEAQVAPRYVSCKAIVCDKCLDKFNLGSFDASGSGGFGGLGV